MPSKIVDIAWHEFILRTREYTTFCHRAFGAYLHHSPDSTMDVPAASLLPATLEIVDKPRRSRWSCSPPTRTRAGTTAACTPPPTSHRMRDDLQRACTAPQAPLRRRRRRRQQRLRGRRRGMRRLRRRRGRKLLRRRRRRVRRRRRRRRRVRRGRRIARRGARAVDRALRSRACRSRALRQPRASRGPSARVSRALRSRALRSRALRQPRGVPRTPRFSRCRVRVAPRRRGCQGDRFATASPPFGSGLTTTPPLRSWASGGRLRRCARARTAALSRERSLTGL